MSHRQYSPHVAASFATSVAADVLGAGQSSWVRRSLVLGFDILLFPLSIGLTGCGRLTVSVLPRAGLRSARSVCDSDQPACILLCACRLPRTLTMYHAEYCQVMRLVAQSAQSLVRFGCSVTEYGTSLDNPRLIRDACVCCCRPSAMKTILQFIQSLKLNKADEGVLIRHVEECRVSASGPSLDDKCTDRVR